VDAIVGSGPKLDVGSTGSSAATPDGEEPLRSEAAPGATTPARTAIATSAVMAEAATVKIGRRGDDGRWAWLRRIRSR
jgi:hypothetical protein